MSETLNENSSERIRFLSSQKNDILIMLARESEHVESLTPDFGQGLF